MTEKAKKQNWEAREMTVERVIVLCNYLGHLHLEHAKGNFWLLGATMAKGNLSSHLMVC